MATSQEPGSSARLPPSRSENSQPGAENERSLPELLSTLTSQLGTLFRKEVDLARAEIEQQVRLAGKAAGALGGAGAAAFMAVLLLSFALAWGLAELMPAWAAFLVVGVVYAVVAAALYATGKRKLAQVDPKPEQTIETLREDAEWARTRRS